MLPVPLNRTKRYVYKCGCAVTRLVPGALGCDFAQHRQRSVQDIKIGQSEVELQITPSFDIFRDIIHTNMQLILVSRIMAVAFIIASRLAVASPVPQCGASEQLECKR